MAGSLDKKIWQKAIRLLEHFTRCAVEGSMIRIDLKQENFFLAYFRLEPRSTSLQVTRRNGLSSKVGLVL